MLLNSLTMVGAILICTSAPYRPGHWLLSDVTPEPGTLQERATAQSVIQGGGQERTGKGGRGLGVICIYGSGVMSPP